MSDLQRRLKRCVENIRGCWRRWRRSDPRQRALRHPPFIPPLPHPQSLRRPCLRGRRGSSTIANGSAAEWWRGGDEANHYAYKSCTERYLKWPFKNLCAACVCTWRASGNNDFQGIYGGEKKEFFFSLAVYYSLLQIKPPRCRSFEFAINVFQKIQPASFTERCSSIYTQPPCRLHSLSQSIYSVSPFLSVLL